MTAREYFVRLSDEVRELEKRKADAREMREQIGVKGQSFGSIGSGGSAKNAMGPVDRVVDVERQIELDQAKLDLELEQATTILYGRSGRGGLAKERGSTTADIICCHYLQLMTYAEIAKSVDLPKSRDPVHWCMMRAHRALEYIDRIGAATLADS